MTTKKLYLFELDRFGYNLQVISDSIENGNKAIMSEYKKTYKHINNCNPSKDELYWAMNDIGYTEMTLNKVSWN